MRSNKPRFALFCGLALAIALFGAPANAQQGKGGDSAAPAASSAPPASSAAPAVQGSTSDMPGMDMSQMETTWPTDADSGGMMMSHHDRPKTFTGRLIAWLGAWHPAVIHFPVALILTVAFLELMAIFRRNPIYAASNKILLALGAAGAFVSAPLGWADAGLPTAQDEWFLVAHRWLGTVIPFIMLGLWRLKRPVAEASTRLSPRGYEIALALTVVAVLVQAFLGGDITHGVDHMAF